MAIAWVKDVGQFSGAVTAQTYVVTLATGVAQGHHLIVSAYRVNTGDTVASVTDSRGNTYTVDYTGAAAVAGRQMGVASGYMATALQSGDTVSIVWTNASAYNYFGAMLVEFSGLATTSWFDKTATAASYGTAIDSGNTATTSQADELIVGAIDHQNAAATVTAGTGFTLLTSNPQTGAGESEMEYKVVSSTGTYSATGTLSGNETWRSVVLTYKQAAAGGGPVIPVFMHHYQHSMRG